MRYSGAPLLLFFIIICDLFFLVISNNYYLSLVVKLESLPRKLIVTRDDTIFF